MSEYKLPVHLEREGIDQPKYAHWLHRKSQSLLRRDRSRGNTTATGAKYKAAIHRAVCDSNGLDAYTDEKLNWKLLSTYDNDAARRGGRKYKRRFALLPTVDHVDDGKGAANFKICSWRTNDSKSDLSYVDFVKLCKKVLSTDEKSKRKGG